MAEVDFLITLTELGAVSDARELRDVAMAASSATLTSPSAPFLEEDVGKPIVVGGAAAAGAKLVTTIASFTSSTEIVLAADAATEVIAGSAVYGTDCSAALDAGLVTIASSLGGTLVIDGKFLLATPVSATFGGETGTVAARLVGYGTDSAIWIGTADSADAISLSSAEIQFRDLNFIGVPGATRDARRVLNLSGIGAAFDHCGFYGLMAQEAVIYASGSSIDTRSCLFGGCFVAAGTGGYTNSVIENKDWVAYRDDHSQFIDYGSFRGQSYSKSGLGANLGWVRADTPADSVGTRGPAVFLLRGTQLDEGALHGIVIKPTTGTVAHVHLDGLRQNVTPAETGRGVHCQNATWVVMERCWQGWADTPALAAHFQNCGTVVVDSLKLSASVNKLSATDVASLTLKDTTGITTFTFSNVNFHPVDSRYGNISLVKEGAVSDADFPKPPALGTLAFDRTNNRLYVKRLATGGGWIYTDISGGDPLGPELVVNGTFASGTTTGWTPSASATLSVVGGALRVTNLTIYGRAYQGVPTVPGQQYQVSVTFTGGTAGRLARIGRSQGEAHYFNFTDPAGGSGIFTATTAMTYIALMLNSETVGGYADFDNISLKAI